MTLQNSCEFQQWVKGTAIMIGGTMVLSFDSLLIRLSADVPEPVTLFWRCCFLGGTVWVCQFLLAWWSESNFIAGIRKMREEIVQAGRWSFLVAISYPVPMIMLVFALRLTSTVDCFVLAGSSPVWSAILSKLISGDELPVHTVVAIVLAMGCVSSIILCSTKAERAGSSFEGNLISLGIAISCSVYFMAVRFARQRNHGKPVLPVLPFGCCVAATFAFFLGDAKLPSVTCKDIFLLWLMGGVIGPLGMSAWTIAAGMISAPECSLIQLVEMMLAPFWTWLFLGEVPKLSSVLAGAGLTAVLALHSYYTGVYVLNKPSIELQVVPTPRSTSDLKEPLEPLLDRP
eukprot:TRINITY_DN4040_c0_g1_i8.p1 TRINITY_DN4040_c0_g1~~TRINITY_DN4040_c0_g1_i8.p1  ORF type:complete len:344 (-),score=30.30 TRINITY_DN4040_c0_g1_i8:146-1177(-)